MKKIILLLFFVLVSIITLNYNIITNNVSLSFDICFKNLFPTLIPFMLISNILIKYNFINELSELFSIITTKFFKINTNCSFAIIMSMIGGTPSNSKYLKELYENNLINIYDIKKCLYFCHFTNPIFILNTIGLTFLNNKEMGLIILISHFISSFIIGLLYRNKKNIIEKKELTQNKKDNFFNILTDSIINTANTLLLILGIITFCLIVTSLIDIIFKISDEYKFVYGLIEITQGLKYLSLSGLNSSIKTIVCSFLISFGGFCIHVQVFSILDNKKIRYLPYLVSRILHGLFSALITIIIIFLN